MERGREAERRRDPQNEVEMGSKTSTDRIHQRDRIQHREGEPDRQNDRLVSILVGCEIEVCG